MSGASATIQATAPALVYPATVLVPVRNDEVGDVRTAVIVAEPTDTPGLAITPGLNDGGLSGGWVVTHMASGQRIPTPSFGDDDMATVQRIAAELGTTPVDWTADADSIRHQVAEHEAAVVQAVRDGLYPPPEPDSTSEVTATTVARGVVQAAYRRCHETLSDLWRRQDEDGRAIYASHAAALGAEFGLAAVLRAFAKIDPAAADAAAREVRDAWEDGASVPELVGEWAREYGIPAPAHPPSSSDERDRS